MRTGGILAYPPRMFEAIEKWLRARYATWVKAGIEDQIEYLRERIEAETDPGRNRERERDLAGYEEVLRLAKRDGARGAPKKAVMRKTFPVDLGGLPASYPTESPFSKIKVIADFTLNREIAGSWHHTRHELTMRFEPRPPDRGSEYQYGLARMRKTLGHELQHMVQDVIEAQHVGGGMPGEYDPARQYENLKGNEAYFLDPREFFTWVGQAEFEFMKAVKLNRHRPGQDEDWDADPGASRKEFDNFVGNPRPVKGKGFARTVGDPLDTNPFFAALWKHDKRRWQRAVKELWKRVGPKLRKLGSDELVLGYLARG